MKLNILRMDYHRNGGGGVGFHVVIFDWDDTESRLFRRMVATVFELETKEEQAVGHNGRVSVFDLDQLHAGNVTFARGNSWRGDHFEESLRKAIKANGGER